MHKLSELFCNRLASGLKRKAITSCSKWTESYRVMKNDISPGLWSFKFHPWLKEIHDIEEGRTIVMKGAQVGFTECFVNKHFYFTDIKGVDSLYVLPVSKPDATDFSSSRINAAIELSPHLQNLFSNVKNIGHKQAGSVDFMIRGSQSRSGLKSIPVGLLTLDELDEHNQKNIELAFERTAGQLVWCINLLSTPSISHYGIHKYFLNSTQEYFFFKCPLCSKFIQFTFPDSLVITADSLDDPNLKNSHIICTECKGTLQHQDKPIYLASGEWQATKPDYEDRGFSCNQFYSSTVSPAKLAEAYIKSFSDPTAEQEFYNSKLGKPHEIEGARVTNEHLQQCMGNYKKDATPVPGLYTMGVDVGHKFLHIEIDQWFLNKEAVSHDVNQNAHCRVVYEGTVREFEELDFFLKKYQINVTVIDAQPEKRKSLDFANRFYGKVYTCFYANVKSKDIKVADNIITVDRTAWLDVALGRFKAVSIELPLDVSKSYKDHLQTLVRVYDKDSDGNHIGLYRKGDKEDDHFAHARNYSEIALQLAASFGGSQNITGVF